MKLTQMLYSSSSKGVHLKWQKIYQLDSFEVFWIRIRDKLAPEPDPDPHHFADDKPKFTEYEPIWALFQGFEPLLGS